MIIPPYGPGAEVPLIGDGVTQGIVRIGDTVRRPMRPMTATVQAYLRHVYARDFTGAPFPLGTDEQGREVLTFVPGDVPAAADPVFRRFWENDWRQAMPRAVAWLERERAAIDRVLR
ncbi:MAG TPA: hypothetical protein VJ010_10195 [Actinomycetota bacterium]|nr:hypothetical protein [Actinomycetota bacterium]